jgi:catechol 2,3-dioxygenase-like lactoylglutathione lyase family enzyme
MAVLRNVPRPHLALTVSDVERSTEFYSALFGIAAVKRKPGYVKFEIEEPALNLTLNEGSRTDSTGAFNHAGIQVASTDDVLAAKLRLTRAGLASVEESDVTCCYARQDKIWVTAPDGEKWEIFVTHQDVEEGDSSESANRQAACCA